MLLVFERSTFALAHLVRDAAARGEAYEDTTLPTVEDLIFFKLYAGGPKSRLDILELMTRQHVDMAVLRERASSYGMSDDLERLLAVVPNHNDD